MVQTKRENIRVVVRFRPLNDRERKIEEKKDFKLSIDTENNTIDINKHHFTFDNVFNHTVAQEEIFEKVAKNSVQWVKEGYNSTIFAYGPTGTGKTHTMFGGQLEEKGIVPRSCDHLFHSINDDESVIEAHVKCSFLEIYRENIRDLLTTDEYKPNLRIRQHKDRGTYVHGLIEKYVYSPKEILETIRKGIENRSTASTLLNDVSSRSHAVLTLYITQKLSDGSEISSKLHLIDLAGSENVGKSDVTGITLKEAQQINKSLSSLGNVIYALTEKGRCHIPYRDSRLTYLLEDSLGGNSKTVLVSTATEHSSVYSETLNTLLFARRAKLIKNKPKVNRNKSNEFLRKTIKNLTARLEELQGKYNSLLESNAEEVVKEVKEVAKDVAKDSKKFEKLQNLLENVAGELVQEKKCSEDYKELFEKQRDLAKNLAKDLFDEKKKTESLNIQLTRYKEFYNMIKSIDDNSSYEKMISRITIEPITVKVDMEIPESEIDSP